MVVKCAAMISIMQNLKNFSRHYSFAFLPTGWVSWVNLPALVLINHSLWAVFCVRSLAHDVNWWMILHNKKLLKTITRKNGRWLPTWSKKRKWDWNEENWNGMWYANIQLTLWGNKKRWICWRSGGWNVDFKNLISKNLKSITNFFRKLPLIFYFNSTWHHLKHIYFR